MSPKSEVFRTSLCLPPGISLEGGLRFSDCVLLDSLAYMVNIETETGTGTGTAAVITTPDGFRIQVSFLITDPPCLSICCICCINREEDPFACVPRILSAVEDLVLIQVDFTNGVRRWFVYWARGAQGNPSLHLLPDLRVYSRKKYMWQAYGLMSHDEGRQFVLAALGFMDGQYNLHIFHSGNSDWTQKLLDVNYGPIGRSKLIEPTYVIALGKGLLGWVDLWEGILICDVLALASDKPSQQPRFIPMPKPLPSNQVYLQHHLPRLIRGVTFNHGQIKCVELEKLVTLRPKAAPVVCDPSDNDLLYDSESSKVPRQDEVDVEYEVVGWRLVNWYRDLTSDCWRRGTSVHSDCLGQVTLPPLSSGDTVAEISSKVLQTFYPTLLGDDVVYLMSVVDKCRQVAWIVPVDTKNNLVSMAIPFSAVRSSLLDPTHIPCALPKYLCTKSDGIVYYRNYKKQRLINKDTEGQ